MNRLKKFGTVLLCGSMIASFVFGSTGCSFLYKSSEQILDVSDSFCKAICDKKPKSAAKLVTEDDSQEYFDRFFCIDAGINTPVVEAIGDNVSYEIDEESVEGSKKDGEGSIDVVFTLIDYEKVASEGEFKNAAELASAVNDSKDTKDIEITLELEYTGDKDNPWLINNYEDVMETLYEFTSFEPEYKVDYASLIDGVYFEASSMDFVNITYLSYELHFSEDLAQYDEIMIVDFSYNGTLIASLDVAADSDNILLDFVPYYGNGIETDDGCFKEGVYEFKVYLDDGTVISSESVQVFYVAPTPTPTPTPEPDETSVPYEESWSYAASLFVESGASIEPEADELGITECEWVRSELDADGNDVDTDSYVAADIHWFGYVVNTPEQHSFTCEIRYFENPNTSLSDLAYSSSVDYESEIQQYSDGTWGYAILIPDPQPGVYIMDISCDEITTAEYGNQIILDIIELT